MKHGQHQKGPHKVPGGRHMPGMPMKNGGKKRGGKKGKH